MEMRYRFLANIGFKAYGGRMEKTSMERSLSLVIIQIWNGYSTRENLFTLVPVKFKKLNQSHPQ